MSTLAITPFVAPRPRAYVGVTRRDAADFLQRMVSNDVAAIGPGDSCEALLLTPKARVIAPLRVLRRADDDFLLLTEPALGETVGQQLVRSRFAAKVAVESEQHRSYVAVGVDVPGIPNDDYGPGGVEVLDADAPDGLEPVGADELERLRILARTPAWGREIDDRVLPAEAGLVERAVSLTKGCYPGQEPIARLHYRRHANRELRVLAIDADELPEYDAELRYGDKVVGRVTSAARSDGGIVALGYVRVEVPRDAELAVGPSKARSLD